MATLVLAGHPFIGPAGSAGTASSLSEWLQDDWAILFSHPDDFVRCELELDRWVALARPAFAASHVRPLALATPKRPLDCGWVSEVSGDARAVQLYDPAARRLNLFDFHARRLREDIEGMDQRFVMVIDTTTRRRKTYAYGAPERLPSPIDLARWAGTLRVPHAPYEAPADSRMEYPAAWPRRDRPETFRSQSAA